MAAASPACGSVTRTTAGASAIRRRNHPGALRVGTVRLEAATRRSWSSSRSARTWRLPSKVATRRRRSPGRSARPFWIPCVPTSSAARSSVCTDLPACHTTRALPQPRLTSSTDPTQAMSRTRSGMSVPPVTGLVRICPQAGRFGHSQARRRLKAAGPFDAEVAEGLRGPREEQHGASRGAR